MEHPGNDAEGLMDCGRDMAKLTLNGRSCRNGKGLGCASRAWLRRVAMGGMHEPAMLMVGDEPLVPQVRLWCVQAARSKAYAGIAAAGLLRHMPVLETARSECGQTQMCNGKLIVAQCLPMREGGGWRVVQMWV